MSTTELKKWTPLAKDEIREHADSLGVELTDEMLDVADALGPKFAHLYNTVGQWWQEEYEPPPETGWKRGDDELNATAYEFDAESTGSGPLNDVTFSVKDTIAVPGVPIAYGCELVDGYIPSRYATIVARLLARGARGRGSGKADSLGLAITGDQNYTGPVRNPWNREHTTMGSSSGVAAQLGAGDVNVAVGVDDAGSVRAPAAAVGAVGILPGRGSIPMTGVLGFTGTQDRIGVMAYRTELAARAASALCGPDGLDLKVHGKRPDWAACLTGNVEGLRIGVVREAFAEELCDKEVAVGVRRRADQLADMGALVSEVSIPRYANAPALAMVLSVQGGLPEYVTKGFGSDASVLRGEPLLARQFSKRRAAHPQQLARTVQLSLAVSHHGGEEPGVWLAAAMDLIPALTEQYTRLFSGPDAVDVLLTPTVPSVPPTVPDEDMPLLEEMERAVGPGIIHTAATNMTGLPAGTLPVAREDYPGGLPVGVQITAPMMREDLIFAVMAACEPEGGYPRPGK